MRFRLFGVPVTIRVFFWLTAVLMGLGYARAVALWALPIWVAVMLVSIVIHEMGHAIAFMRHGIRPAITLHGMGGVTIPGGGAELGRFDSAIVSLAGPLAGLVAGGLFFLAQRALPPDLPIAATVTLSFLVWVNVGWSLFNLLPILPFDGGHILQEILGPRRMQATAMTSLAFSILLAAISAWYGNLLMALLFAMSAIQSWQLYTLPPGAILVNPFTAPDDAPGMGGPGPVRRWWLKRKLARLQAEAAGLDSERRPARRRAGGPDLRVIKGGADRPKDKRFLN
jgi:Zn-dependent protease